MRFDVRALDPGGGLAVHTLEADSEGAAREEASRRGLAVLSVRAARAFPLALPARRRAFPLLLFTQELIALLDAGLGAAEALEALSAKEGGRMGGVLRGVLDCVRGGAASRMPSSRRRPNSRPSSSRR